MSRPPSGARASRASGLSPSHAMSPPYGAPANGSHASFLPPPQPGPMTSMSVISRPPSRHEPPPLGATNGPMPGTLNRPINGPKKRLIMTCDGTWLNADSAIKNGQKTPPSNVSRIGWAIKETSRDGIPQVVNYQAGVGTEGGKITKIISGATGHGLKENVREAYTFLATNWREGDEIFLIGFSRGAFTARSVGGFIGELGLLTRTGLPFFNEIWEDFEHKMDDRYVSPFPNAPFPKKPRFGRSYIRQLEDRDMTRTRINIKAICCFDTVGNLGIPATPFTSMLRGGRQTREYQFFDTSLSPCIENAFQALALDENRAPFSPALWEKQGNTRTNLKQVWFPGVHSNIGGGYDDQEIADLTLAWMMSRLEAFLDFRPDFLIMQYEENKKYYKSTRQRPRPWSFGEIYRSLRGVYALSGSKVRTPGSYCRTDPFTMRTTDEPLRETNEYIHASVRTRLGLRGPGIEDRGTYEPRALQNWTYEVQRPLTGGGGGPSGHGNLDDGGLYMWTYHGTAHVEQRRIPEAILLPTELALLKQSPKIDEFVRTGQKPKSSRRSRMMEKNGHGHNSGPNGVATAGGGGGGGGLNDSPMSDPRRRRSARYGSRPPPMDRGGGGGGGPSGLDNDPEYDSMDDRDRRRRRRRSSGPGGGGGGGGDYRDLDDDDHDLDNDYSSRRPRSSAAAPAARRSSRRVVDDDY